jgi:hypothetical protein
MNIGQSKNYYFGLHSSQDGPRIVNVSFLDVAPAPTSISCTGRDSRVSMTRPLSHCTDARAK